RNTAAPTRGCAAPAPDSLSNRSWIAHGPLTDGSGASRHHMRLPRAEGWTRRRVVVFRDLTLCGIADAFRAGEGGCTQDGGDGAGFRQHIQRWFSLGVLFHRAGVCAAAWIERLKRPERR